MSHVQRRDGSGDCTLTYGGLTYECSGCSYNKTVTCAHLPYGDGYDCVKKDETKAMITPNIYGQQHHHWKLVDSKSSYRIDFVLQFDLYYWKYCLLLQVEEKEE